LLAQRARVLASDLSGIDLDRGSLQWRGYEIARIERGASAAVPRLVPGRELTQIPDAERKALLSAIDTWITERLAPLAPLAKIEAATHDRDAGSEARALLLNLVAAHGALPRERAGVEHLPKEARPYLRRLGVVFGALDVFAPALLKPAARAAFHAAGIDRRPLAPQMPSVLPSPRNLPAGYRPAGDQAIRVDISDKLLRLAHEARTASKSRHFTLDTAMVLSTGLKADNWIRLLGAAGFKVQRARTLPAGAFGPPGPDRWTWRPVRREAAQAAPRPREGSAFAALADLAL
ncbi:MAG: helicase, partial [Tsuneonella sp.]